MRELTEQHAPLSLARSLAHACGSAGMSGRTGSARLMASVSSVASNSLARLIPSPRESARTASARSRVSFSSAEPAFFFKKN